MTLPDWFSTATSALDEKLGLEVLELTPERIVGRMPVAGNTQPMGLWHGGASCVLAETLASLGAMAHALPDRLAFGVDINATHHRSGLRRLGDRHGHRPPPRPHCCLVRDRPGRRRR